METLRYEDFSLVLPQRVVAQRIPPDWNNRGDQTLPLNMNMCALL